jgi:N-terminal domain of NWD NACHT-NTPase
VPTAPGLSDRLECAAVAGLKLTLSKLLLNPPQQEASRVAGLDRIASIIRECSIREAIYRSRYETKNGNPMQDSPAISHIKYRDTLKNLYVQIITFQATYVSFLSGNTGKRWAQDIVNWKEWDKMVEDIVQKNNDIKSMDELWRDQRQQEEWALRINQHHEQLERLDALRAEIQRFYDLVSEAQNKSERSNLLGWLQTVKPSTFYDDAIGKRGATATGNWLLEEEDFKNWKSKPNSFLWLRGKGT